MRLLFACEYYHPSRGGVQEVMRQIAERMVQAGHTVTVATTRMAERDFTELNGVHIEEFDVRGNRANGLVGETARYEDFLKTFQADAIMIKAAQQWTFDAAWPVLDQIKARKVFIPCGFSGFFDPVYKTYFQAMPEILRKFDQLIFYAESYRDVDFARKHGLSNIVILPNGASDVEFAVPADPTFRSQLGIGADEFVILTVGSPINAKGHTELAAAFTALDIGDRRATLILNGQWPTPAPTVEAAVGEGGVTMAVIPLGSPSVSSRARHFYTRATAVLKHHGALAFMQRSLVSAYFRTRTLGRKVAYTAIAPLKRRASVASDTTSEAATLTATQPPQSRPPTVDDWIEMAMAQRGKTVLKTHFSREQTVQAFFAADLFVFASIIEYSPLVLFEAAAAGLPFLTVPVGNANEIIRWTGGGEVCPANKDAHGYTRVDPAVLAENIKRLMDDADLRARLGESGRHAWQLQYNWGAIAKRYEAVLSGETTSREMPPRA